MQNVKRKAVALVAALTVAAPVAAGLPMAGAADPVAWADGPVTVRVELDLPSFGDGPRVFERTNVIPGPGFELTPDDEIGNPSEWCGSVTVDIDPDTSTVTVATAQIPEEADDEELDGPRLRAADAAPGMTWDDCDFETAAVTITGAPFTGFALVSDGLWELEEEGGEIDLRAAEIVPNQMNLVEVGSAPATGAIARWAADPSDESYDLVPGGAAVFSWDQPAPTTTTTTLPPTSVTPTTAPAVDAAAARPVPAQPRYTG